MIKIKITLVFLALCAVVLAQDNNDTQPQHPRARKIRVSAGVLRGVVDHAVVPEYPDDALKSRIQGSVTFIVIVDETGKVVTSTPVEGEPLLVAASVDALREFHFRPYIIDGFPLQVESQIGFRFTLKGEGAKTTGTTEYTFDVPYRPEFRPGAVNGEGKLTLWPRKISGPKPQLPLELAGKPGSVYLSFTIGVDGKVQDVKVISGDAPFVDAVVSAVKQDVYEPEVINGTPAVAETDVSYHFGSRN